MFVPTPPTRPLQLITMSAVDSHEVCRHKSLMAVSLYSDIITLTAESMGTCVDIGVDVDVDVNVDVDANIGIDVGASVAIEKIWSKSLLMSVPEPNLSGPPTTGGDGDVTTVSFSAVQR